MLSLAIAALASPALDTCNVWRTLHETSCQYCDDPSEGGPWARDLNKLLGPQCGPGVPSSSCCWQPLGYDNGPKFTDPCTKVCQDHGRVGNDTAFCGKSDHSKYGNCFCGPAKQVHAHAG